LLDRQHYRYGRYALARVVQQHYFNTGPDDVGITEYINNNADAINSHFADAIQTHINIKWYATLDVSLYRVTADGDMQETTARFRTAPTTLSDIGTLSIVSMAEEFDAALQNFNRRGSGWLVDRILNFSVTLAPYRPMQGLTFIPTPPEIANKKAIINIKNTDNLCFLYSVLAAIHHVDGQNRHNAVWNYKKYLPELNIHGLSFPLPPRDVKKIRRAKP